MIAFLLAFENNIIGELIVWICGTIYQPLRSGRIWHKVNF